MKLMMKAGKMNIVKVKKVSGYNVFSKESRVGMELPPKEIMSKLGGMWKELSETKKKEWNERASRMNAKALSEFEEPEVEEEFKRLKCMIEKTIKEYKAGVKKSKKTVKEVEVEVEVEEEVEEEDEEDVEDGVEEDEIDIEKCSVAELKNMCKERELLAVGVRAVLMKRLLEYEPVE
jgi:hypothetical protein